jgi:hypothetical protein
MKKNNKLGLLNVLKESIDEQYEQTLTEKEVFIVEYLLTEIDETILNRIETAFDTLDPYGFDNLHNIFKPILVYLGGKHLNSDKRLIQYVLCANNNRGKEINTNTQIKRLKKLRFSVWSIEKQIVYNKFVLDNIPISSDDEQSDVYEKIMDDFWRWNPDSHDSDYGDSEMLGFEDAEFDTSDYLVIS